MADLFFGGGSDAEFQAARAAELSVDAISPKSDKSKR
jgi:hypothetical protein